MVGRILKWALVASCVLSVAGSALIVAATLHTKTAHGSYLRITGGSMEPTIAKGEVIGVDPTLAIGVGSVITFAKDGKTTTHRVVKKWQSHDSFGTQRTVYQTKGDANTTDDPWVVTDNEVIGVLTSTPLLIRLALPLIDNPFLAAMFALPFLLIVMFSELRNLFISTQQLIAQSRKSVFIN
jgi:signal peptidase I